MVVKEHNGVREFNRASRWNSLEETIITPKNANAPYADNTGGDKKRLFITYVSRRDKLYPLRRFEPLDQPVILEDFAKLTLKDPVSGYFLEFNEDKSKARLYLEVSK